MNGDELKKTLANFVAVGTTIMFFRLMESLCYSGYMILKQANKTLEKKLK